MEVVKGAQPRSKVRELNQELGRELKRAEASLRMLKERLASERLQRVSAQEGLVRRLREPCVACGQKWHDSEIGYDPREDPEIIALLEAGEIPTRERTPLRRSRVIEVEPNPDIPGAFREVEPRNP